MDERSFGTLWQDEFETCVLEQFHNHYNNLAGQKDYEEFEAALSHECMWDDLFALNDTPASEIHMISKCSDQSNLSPFDNFNEIEEPSWEGKCLARTMSTHCTNQLPSISLSRTTTIEGASPSLSSSSGNESNTMEYHSPILRSNHPSSWEHHNEVGGGEGEWSRVISSPTKASCQSISVCSSQKTYSSSTMPNVSFPIEPYNGTFALPSTMGLDSEHTKINLKDITKMAKIQMNFIPVMPVPSSVAYPFTIVKPSVVQGDITLDDINQRISTKTMSMNRPSYSHSPLPHGIKVSKEPLLSPIEEQTLTLRPHKKIKRHSSPIIVARTKIHTKGKGSITIIRTKN